jgi:hypothetical protein
MHNNLFKTKFLQQNDALTFSTKWFFCTPCIIQGHLLQVMSMDYLFEDMCIHNLSSPYFASLSRTFSCIAVLHIKVKAKLSQGLQPGYKLPGK